MESNCSLCGAFRVPRRSVRLERQYQSAIPFHHLSASNLPPTDLVLSDIQTAALPALDQDILALDAANYENIISTRRRIPAEIWSEIFLYAHSLNSDKEFDWPTRTIWQLSQVCQTWRNLALSLHSCWSSTALEFSLDWPASERDVELLAFVLERSHQHLLDVTILDYNNDDLPFTCRMREKVFAESHRWRTARLVIYHDVTSDLLYAPLRGRLPSLELLDFESIVRGDHATISAFKDCPRLVTVGLAGVNPRIVELPMKQITCLRLYDNRPGDVFRAYMDLIGQCPLLEILLVDSESERAQDPLLSLTLPCLRDLTATYLYLLDSLTLPRLEVAALDQRSSSPHPDTLYSFYCLIRRSNCAGNLTELRITRVSLTLHRAEPHLLLSILSQTTKLATLQVDASMRHSDEWSRTQIIDVMKALEITDDHNSDCIPYLEPHNDFVAMLKARHAGNEDGLSKLEKFRFCLCARRVFTRRSEDNFPIFNDYETSVLR
ncbi:hypothetical protein BDZ89DRAFT_1159315 [Hymenopellis radicata]|nr:hypothetical protein BDZ89DRAFT_1159315 [Hymenopellis radicata]